MLGALHVEVGESGLGGAVEVVVGQAHAVQRQMLHQVGDAGPGQRLVGDADTEDESGAHRPVGLREEGGYAVGLGTVDGGLRVHLRPLFGVFVTFVRFGVVGRQPAARAASRCLT
ncbi:hypothetical protein ACFY2M_24410 [Streptomyces sp. NPDC001276]|uniref:hypothetical protein n=1 Tax=Streptomyces sp. NPDC001276 TaxID=3364555 RepID=UPI0036763BC4